MDPGKSGETGIGAEAAWDGLADVEANVGCGIDNG